jgi:methionyl-tRNA formyltransferase
MADPSRANPLRIGFFGGGDQAVRCLESMIAAQDSQIVFAHLRSADDRVLRELCLSASIDILDHRNVNAADTLDQIKNYEPQLLVSVNAKQIFKSELLSIPEIGAINVHNGLLPLQRGGGGAYTAIINGETPGTTVHFIDEGIDTGDVLMQRKIPISDTDTMGDFQCKAVSESAAILTKTIAAIRNGTAVRTPQRDLEFHYTPRKAPWDELVDWTESTRLILDKIRARTPGPANFYLYEDTRFEIVSAEAEPKLLDYINTPGQVLQRDPSKGVLVKTGDSGLWLRRVRQDTDAKEIVPDHAPGALLRYVVEREIYELRAKLVALERRLEEQE